MEIFDKYKVFFIIDDEEDEFEDDENDEDFEDPGTLYCICRQPHNQRYV